MAYAKKKSKKSSNITSNKKLIKIFSLIFLIAFLASLVSYFTIKNRDSIKTSVNVSQELNTLSQNLTNLVEELSLQKGS